MSIDKTDNLYNIIMQNRKRLRMRYNERTQTESRNDTKDGYYANPYRMAQDVGVLWVSLKCKYDIFGINEAAKHRGGIIWHKEEPDPMPGR